MIPHLRKIGEGNLLAVMTEAAADFLFDILVTQLRQQPLHILCVSVAKPMPCQIVGTDLVTILDFLCAFAVEKILLMIFQPVLQRLLFFLHAVLFAVGDEILSRL